MTLVAWSQAQPDQAYSSFFYSSFLPHSSQSKEESSLELTRSNCQFTMKGTLLRS